MAIKFLNTVVVDAGVLKVDASSNRVGINTNNPGGELQVVGAGSIGNIYISANAAGSSVTDSLHIKKEALKASIINRDGGDLALGANGSEYVTIKGTGNVGIGTTSPATKLHVSGGDIRIDDTERIEFGAGGVRINNDAAGRMYYNAPLGYYWQAGSSYKMVLLNSGNVGIGTTSPSTALSVNGAISAITSDYVQGTTGSRLLMHSAGTGNSHSYIQAQSSGGTSSAEDLALQLYGGNVGIGTSSPNYKLEVSGTLGVNRTDGIIFAGSAAAGLGNKITSDTSNNFIFSTSGPSIPYTTSTRMTILNGGNVGIGTTSPSAKLDVVQGTAANGAAALHLIGPNTNPGLTSSVLIIEQSDGKKITMDGNDIDVSSGDLFINDYSGEDVTFGGQIKVKGLGSPVGDSYISNGNFGIGTTSPGTKLDVRGSLRADLITLFSGSTQFLNVSGYGGAPWINTATSGGLISFGAPSSNTTNVYVQGTVEARDAYINQRVAWNVGFNHGSNNAASYYFIPVGYLAETTSDTYYNNWIAPYAGRVRKIVMRNTGQSTVPTATTVNFRVSVNGSVVYTGSTITVTGSGLNILASQTLSDTNAVFSATDRVQVAYRTNGLWRNAATGISLEYTE